MMRTGWLKFAGPEPMPTYKNGSQCDLAETDMEIKPTKTKADYEAALVEIDRLFDAELDTPEGDRLEVFVARVKAYERKHSRVLAGPPVSEVPATGVCRCGPKAFGLRYGQDVPRPKRWEH